MDEKKTEVLGVRCTMELKKKLSLLSEREDRKLSDYLFLELSKIAMEGLNEK